MKREKYIGRLAVIASVIGLGVIVFTCAFAFKLFI